MGKRNTDPLPEEVDFLRMEVQEWRRTKAGPGAPMPTEIWETAVRLARGFGVCRIARATERDPKPGKPFESGSGGARASFRFPV